MTIKEQVEKWVNGESIHDEEHDTCCPDFSCCNSKLKADKANRELFAKAYSEGNDALIGAMLTGFIGQALKSLTHKKVHVVSTESALQDN